ncbi:MAG: class I SAM-dependent methyltransferase [Candidatus Omnitrophica bacterium]|nr:class I SAM-dependent methyltransferase [Candidatus Omnitrophota bacterium]
MRIGRGFNSRDQRPKLKGEVTQEKALKHAEILSNSVRNKYKHLAKRFRKANIECFRLYDWDTSEIRIVVDWYAGHLVVSEYERLQTGPEYLPQMADAVAVALNVPKENVHIRTRHTNVEEGPRYTKLASEDKRMEVKEGDLKFLINLTDFLDTGLFSDHRQTRILIRKMAEGKDFLNLFAYTGAFTCAAALGNARSIVTVDRSETYINWTKDNLELNGLWNEKHKLVQADALKYLERARKEGIKFDLAFIDPPSFFKEKATGADFDINRDHPELINNVLKLMHPGSDILFSTNHQRFVPIFDDIKVKEIIQLTPKTIPEDYRNRNIHHCWHIKV